MGAEVKEYTDEELGYPSRDKDRFGLVGVPDAGRLEMIEESDKHESRQECELVTPREGMGPAHKGLWAAIGTSMRDGSARVQGNSGD